MSHQPGCIGIDYPQVLLTGAIADSGRDERFPGTGAAGDKDVLFLFDERKVCKALHEVLVQSPLHGVVYLLH